MGDLVNLRRVKKAKARLAKESVAEENRARFGRSLSERKASAAEAILELRRLDSHRCESVQDSDIGLTR